MLKETIICIVIVVGIIIGSILTQNYTQSTVEKISKKLVELKEELIKGKNVEENEIKNLEKEWDEKKKKLAYFLEHDELEKVETNLVGMKSFIKTKEYTEAICELEKGIFVLKHIEEKYALSLENIF